MTRGAPAAGPLTAAAGRLRPAVASGRRSLWQLLLCTRDEEPWADSHSLSKWLP